MKKIAYAVATLAAIAIGVPSIASAEDMKPGMTREGMKDGSLTHRVHHHMYMDARPHYNHHTMKKGMMKQEM